MRDYKLLVEEITPDDIKIIISFSNFPIPRVGEELIVCGKNYTVIKIFHDWECDDGADPEIIVRVKCI